MTTLSAERLASALDRRSWPYETCRFECLGFDFTVRATDAELGRYVESLYAACAVPGEASHRFSLRTHGDGRVTVYLDGAVRLRRVAPGIAVTHLVWEVNRAAVEHTHDHLLLHAAAAERDGRVVLLPAAMESGKSTLVAGLVRAGLRYLTDETVAIDLATLRARAYPKPIGLDPGSWAVHAELESHTAGAPEPLPSLQWLVPSLALHPEAVAAGGRVTLVALPRYLPDGPDRLRPIPRAEALVALAENSFNFHTLGVPALHAAAALLRGAACFALDVCDLDRATRLLLDAFDREAQEASP